MINWLFKKYAQYLENKCIRKLGGIPLMWVIYHPDEPVPNIDFMPHPMFKGDVILNGKCKEMAEYMRDHYLEVKTQDNARIEAECKRRIQNPGWITENGGKA